MDRSDTQLLDASPIIHENSSFCISSEESTHRPFVLKTHNDNASFSDFGLDYLRDQRHTKRLPIDEICQDLMVVVKSLQAKLEKGDTSLLQSLRNSSTASTVKQARGAVCDSWKEMLLELV